MRFASTRASRNWNAQHLTALTSKWTYWCCLATFREQTGRSHCWESHWGYCRHYRWIDTIDHSLHCCSCWVDYSWIWKPLRFQNTSTSRRPSQLGQRGLLFDSVLEEESSYCISWLQFYRMALQIWALRQPAPAAIWLDSISSWFATQSIIVHLHRHVRPSSPPPWRSYETRSLLHMLWHAVTFRFYFLPAGCQLPAVPSNQERADAPLSASIPEVQSFWL